MVSTPRTVSLFPATVLVPSAPAKPAPPVSVALYTRFTALVLAE
jgi:hypothetical protein